VNVRRGKEKGINKQVGKRNTSKKGEGKGHPITGHQGPRGGVEV
jgi:hypothetical protein